MISSTRSAKTLERCTREHNRRHSWISHLWQARSIERNPAPARLVLRP
jgi:hypothetical protein